jgi:hypothetical protein
MGSSCSSSGIDDVKNTNTTEKSADPTTQNESRISEDKIGPPCTSKESAVLISVKQELANQSDVASDTSSVCGENKLYEIESTSVVFYLNQNIRAIRNEKKLFTDDCFSHSTQALFDNSSKTNIFGKTLCEKLGIHGYNFEELNRRVKWDRCPVSDLFPFPFSFHF